MVPISTTLNMSPTVSKITETRAANSAKAKSEVLQQIQTVLKEEVFSLDPAVTRIRNIDSARATMLQKKMAVKLAVKMIQENMNHGGSNYFTDSDYYGRITDPAAIRLFNEIMDGTLQCGGGGESLKSKLEYICCHRNTLFTNRKYSFYKTNYTDSADALRQFIDSCAPGSSRVIFNGAGKQLTDIVDDDVQNLSVEGNHGMLFINIAMDVSYTHSMDGLGKWCVAIAPDRINALMGQMKDAWPSTLSRHLLELKVFLVAGNKGYWDPKTQTTVKPETFNAIFYVADYKNKRQVKQAYDALVSAGIIDRGQNIGFKLEMETAQGGGEFLFTASVMDDYYASLKVGK